MQSVYMPTFRRLEIVSITVDSNGLEAELQLFDLSSSGLASVSGPPAVHPVWVTLITDDGNRPEHLHLVLDGDHSGTEGMTHVTLDGKVFIGVDDEMGSSPDLVHIKIELCNGESLGAGPRMWSTPTVISRDLAGSVG